MDIFIPIILVIIFCIMFSVCGWCCKRHREGTVYGYGGTPVTVGAQNVNASPVVVPPYPIDPRHPTPQASQPPGPGFNTNIGGFQQPAYPPTTGAPYPGAAPYPPVNVAPYPTSTPYPPQTAPPPSYLEAVSQPPPMPAVPSNEMYSKQAPYNPNF